MRNQVQKSPVAWSSPHFQQVLEDSGWNALAYSSSIHHLTMLPYVELDTDKEQPKMPAQSPVDCAI